MNKAILILVLICFLVAGCIEEDTGKKVVVKSSGNNIDDEPNDGDPATIVIEHPEERDDKDFTGDECDYDSDCVWVQTSCCPCTQGGTEVCAPWSKKAELERTDKECQLNVICGGRDNCKPPEACQCLDGYCK